MKIHDSSRISWLHSSFEIFMTQIFGMGFFWVLNFAPIRPSLSLEIQSTPWENTRGSTQYVKQLHQHSSLQIQDIFIRKQGDTLQLMDQAL